MNHSLTTLFYFNLIVNSVLTFFTVALLIHLFMALFRIKNERIKIFAYIVPIVKLPLDVMIGYNFPTWALTHGIDPTTCEEGTRLISVVLGTNGLFFGFSVHDMRFNFTLADLLAIWLGPVLTAFITITILAATALSILLAFRKYLLNRKRFNRMLALSEPYQRPIFNPTLNSMAAAKQLNICISDQISTPCVAGFWMHTVLFPKGLSEQLSQEEYEAVIAHEIEHIRWYDSIMKLGIYIIHTLFWWIPKKWLVRKLELNQELACDKSSVKYLIDPMHLAMAIQKAAAKARLNPHSYLGMSHFTKGYGLLLRLNRLVGDRKKEPRPILKWVQLAFMSFVLVCFLFGKIWTF